MATISNAAWRAFLKTASFRGVEFKGEGGGQATFEMVFVEAGSLNGNGVTVDTQSAVTAAATTMGSAASAQLDATMQGSLSSGTIST